MSAMTHRGPDGEGLYVSQLETCVLGHRRLTILDLTDYASQPMIDASRNHVLCYNGECYNYRELRHEMHKQGELFTSSGDTEVVLRMLSRRGPDCLQDLNAMFALAFWNEDEQTLLLARDRFGQKPLYYTVQKGLLIFASEVRALLASGLMPRRADAESVRNFFACGSVCGPKTIVENVRLLPSSHYLVIPANGTFQTNPRSYWSAPRDKVEAIPEELRGAFAAAVSRHMISDVPVGVFLSGGIDSSAIAAGAMRELGRGVTTLCVVYPDQPGECESLHAKRVADAIGSNHVEVPIMGSCMVDLARRALDAMDQPTIDGVNTFVVSYAAHEAGLKVALSGLGGDELFGGYRSTFSDTSRLLTLKRKVGPLVSHIGSGLLRLGGDNRRSAKIGDALIAPDGLIPAYLVRRRLFTSWQIQRMYPAVGLSGWYRGIPCEQFEFLESLISDRNAPDALGLMEMEQYMGQQLLRDTDVMGMANSLEIRVPFLDADFASLALRLPSSARIPGMVQKHRFVEAIREWLPPENISRPKQGFSMPFESWMMSELHEDVCAGVHGLIRTLPGGNESSIQRIVSDFYRNPDRVGWSRPWALFVLGHYLNKMGLIVAME